MSGWGLVFGGLVGFALGMTGGGGSILAVPLLVYGLAIAPQEAVGISLAAVGMTALVGAVARIRTGEVEIGTGVTFALAGMLGAPLGTWIATILPEHVLLLSFAGLMLVVAVRMWRRSSHRPEAAAGKESGDEPHVARRRCERDAAGHLRLDTRCGATLIGLGLTTGVLSGLFGVGGGFVVVPALVLFTGMGIHHAVATSLLVIALVSAAGVTSHVVAGQSVSLAVSGLFVVGGLVGLWLGQRAGKRLAGPQLQKLFAAAIVMVAVFVISQNIHWS